MYGVITTVPTPVEMYDGMHAEMIRRAGTSIDGLCTSGVQPPTASRCWKSGSPRSTTTAPTLTSSSPDAGIGGDRPSPSIEQAIEAFDVHGLVIPRGNILI